MARWARLELFSVLRATQESSRGSSWGLGPKLQLAGQRGAWGLGPEPWQGTHYGPSRPEAGEGKDPYAGATGSRAFERQQQPGCRALLARGTFQQAAGLGERNLAPQEVGNTRPSSPASEQPAIRTRAALSLLCAELGKITTPWTCL